MDPEPIEPDDPNESYDFGVRYETLTDPLADPPQWETVYAPMDSLEQAESMQAQASAAYSDPSSGFRNFVIVFTPIVVWQVWPPTAPAAPAEPAPTEPPL